ncbi:MAG: hypothetical protein ACOCWQ_01555 [Nanoarchaeota archaeon]
MSSQPNPAEIIAQLRANNMSNNQIVQYLQQQGFNSNQIFEALNMADMKQGFQSPGQPPQMGQPQNPMNMNPQNMAQNQGQQPNMPPPGMPPPNMPPPEQQDSPEDVEELIEAVIEEKWGELKQSVEKIVAWKEKTESRIAQVEQRFDDLKKDYDKLHQALIGKIGEYDKNVLDVGTQLQAMEKAFSQVLPTLTENVNELSRITDKLKQ